MSKKADKRAAASMQRTHAAIPMQMGRRTPRAQGADRALGREAIRGVGGELDKRVMIRGCFGEAHGAPSVVRDSFTSTPLASFGLRADMVRRGYAGVRRRA